ncbi:hypothetical protein B0H17DRAFT_1176547 [Mycena rosella]|uniref:Uncharacterized protein n=1 Tax=Mycena rosella TaxID=1033263 RepID=A0AAD7DX53_MYCRO|nr:hypothetical protein B0H17DRAFT_1176547 [Mycena rosella]
MVVSSHSAVKNRLEYLSEQAVKNSLEYLSVVRVPIFVSNKTRIRRIKIGGFELGTPGTKQKNVSDVKMAAQDQKGHGARRGIIDSIYTSIGGLSVADGGREEEVRSRGCFQQAMGSNTTVITQKSNNGPKNPFSPSSSEPPDHGLSGLTFEYMKSAVVVGVAARTGHMAQSVYQPPTELPYSETQAPIQPTYVNNQGNQSIPPNQINAQVLTAGPLMMYNMRDKHVVNPVFEGNHLRSFAYGVCRLPGLLITGDPHLD